MQIMESLNVEKEEIRVMLRMLKPDGCTEFYKQYIRRNYQFCKHNTSVSDLVSLNKTNVPGIWYPILPHLNKLQIECFLSL